MARCAGEARDRLVRFCYALARARELGRVDRDTVGRLLDLVAKGGLDDLRFEGEEGWCVPRRAVAEVAAQGDGKWPPPADELRGLVGEGLSCKEIAARYGVTPQAVGWQFKRLGLVRGGNARGAGAASGPANDAPGSDCESLITFLREALARGASVRVQVELTLQAQQMRGS